MPRPLKCRRVCGCPRADYFRPGGVLRADLEVVRLTMDEFEALRLADLKGLYQEKAAAEMRVSRQTFGNIIGSAHRKLADVVVNTKAMKIEGGVVQFVTRGLVCPRCKQVRTTGSGANTRECPQCLKRKAGGPGLSKQRNPKLRK
jgi:uncharacterized protein